MRQSNALVAAACGWLLACDGAGQSGSPVPSGGAAAARPSLASSTARQAALERRPGAPLEAPPLQSPRPLRKPGASPPPGAVPEPPSPLFAACHRGFAPSAAPAVDVVRLGMLCGASNGLSLLTRTAGDLDEAGKAARFQWEAERGDCFLLFAVADEGVDDLELEVDVLGPKRSRILLANQSERWVVAGEDRPFCAVHAGTFEARLVTHGGRGAFSAAVWRGARMLPRKSTAGTVAAPAAPGMTGAAPADP